MYRPECLQEFVGQEGIKTQLNILIYSSLIQQKSLPHMLFYGPPGLGKTTLAYIIAKEMESRCHMLLGPMIKDITDITKIFNQMYQHDILFIDEIHRMAPGVQERLYTVLEDNKLILKSRGIFSIKVTEYEVLPFVMIGATTTSGMLVKPFRDRFPVQFTFQPYTIEERIEIAKQYIDKEYGQKIVDEVAIMIAQRCRGIARDLVHLIDRLMDLVIASKEEINSDLVELCFQMLGIDERGLNNTDIDILRALAEYGKPLGIKALASMTGHDMLTIEEVVEPYLVQEKLVARTPRGRTITPLGCECLREHGYDIDIIEVAGGE